jgi:hypothetical protein
MESLELWAKITINAVILGGSHDIDEKTFKNLLTLEAIIKSPVATLATKCIILMMKCFTKRRTDYVKRNKSNCFA